MFQFPGFPSHDYVFIIRYLDITLSEFPHSEILGSQFTCNSPKLIAAYHVLHRLREPRHPPSALAYFLFPCTYNALRHVSDWYIFKACSFFVTLLLCCPSCQRSSFQRLFVVERIKNHRFFFLLLWRITDSNRWPSACKADALASWANPPNLIPFVVPGRVELPTSTLSV